MRSSFLNLSPTGIGNPDRYAAAVAADRPTLFVRVVNGAIIDCSGNGYTMTAVKDNVNSPNVGLSNPGYTKYANSMTFTRQQIVYGPTALNSWCDGRQTLTTECWAKLTAPYYSSGSWNIALGWGYAWSEGAIQIGAYWHQLLDTTYHGDYVVHYSENYINPDIWHHFVYVLDSPNSCSKVYMDGRLVFTNTVPANYVLPTGIAARFAIGGPSGSNNDWVNYIATQGWVGDVADVAIYPQALSAARVLAHYKAGRKSLIDQYMDYGPVACWPLDTLDDISGNGYDLTPWLYYSDAPVFGQLPIYPGGPLSVAAGGFTYASSHLESPAMPASIFQNRQPCSFCMVKRWGGAGSGAAVYQHTVDRYWQGVGYELHREGTVFLPQRNNNDHGYLWAGTSANNSTQLCIVTYDGTYLRGYIDGVLYGTGSKTANLTYPEDPKLCIGGNAYADSGLTSSVAIFNRCLSDSEITTLTNRYLGV